MLYLRQSQKICKKLNLVDLKLWPVKLPKVKLIQAKAKSQNIVFLRNKILRTLKYFLE